MSPVVTAYATHPAPKSLPLQHGMLHVTGASSTGSAAPTDAYDVLVDDGAELTMVLLDVESESARPELREEALAVVGEAVRARAPMYELVSALRTFSAGERKTAVSITLLRFSQPDARVEILNAGMPAVACVLPDGRLTLHAALSPAIGRRFGDVHPYELSPLIWGSSWFALSDGLTAGKQGPEDVRSWLSHHDLHKRGPELSALKPAALAALLAELAPASEARSFGDASLLVLNADPTRRFRSGIQS